MKTISIVVPVFNSGETIRSVVDRCLAPCEGVSVEVIVVDDYSKDNTCSVVEDYFHGDARVVLKKNCENLGPGASRNIGVNAASGEFLMFLDSDDYIDMGSVSKSIELMDNHGADVLVSKYSELQSYSEFDGVFGTFVMSAHDEWIFESVLNGAACKLVEIEKYPQLLEFTNFPWNKICRRDFYVSRGIEFPNLRLNEDILPHWRLLLESKTVLLVDQCLVYHFVPPLGNNATNERGELRIDAVYAVKGLSEYLKLHNVEDAVYIAFLKFSVRFLIWAKSMCSDNKRRELIDVYIDIVSGGNMVLFEKLIRDDAEFSYSLNSLVFI